MNWTEEQQRVIGARGNNLLVSAAAGSGKTAVLVERIIGRILDPADPVDLDELLIVTFTRAAAGEMKERIMKRLADAMEHDPDNSRLADQMTLLNYAQITTIDGFCSFVIRTYPQLSTREPGAKVGEEGELKLMRSEAMEAALDEAFRIFEEGQEEDLTRAKKRELRRERFRAFVETFAPGRSEKGIRELIARIYDASMSSPDPAGYLAMCRESASGGSLEEIRQSPWMQFLLGDAREAAKSALAAAEENLRLTERPDGPEAYRPAAEADAAFYSSLAAAEDYEAFHVLLSEFSLPALSRKKAGKDEDPALREVFKKNRAEAAAVREDLAARFVLPFARAAEFQQKSGEVLQVLADLAERFGAHYAERKERKMLLDFADLEHEALHILMPGGERSYAAKELSARFREVMVDEYQDSNYLQEAILTAVSRIPGGDPNYFQVGDVRQSIYSFRQARPDLFMRKYSRYPKHPEEGERIDLSRNFRSRPEVLSYVNTLFRQIMRPEIGGIAYGTAEELVPGLISPEAEGFEAVLMPLLAEEGSEELKGARSADLRDAEARAVGTKILQLVKTGTLPQPDGSVRAVEYRDIVILLRTMEGWADHFLRVFEELGIPAYSSAKSGYFTALEVVTVLNYLRILDNPEQDIPFTAVLHAPFGNVTAEELAYVRAYPEGISWAGSRERAFVSMHEAARAYAEGGENAALREKLVRFFAVYDGLRARVPDTPIYELISRLLRTTGYLDYASALPGGAQRALNLRMLIDKAVAYSKTSYTGLFHFVNYIESLQKQDADFGELSTISEAENVVRILSVHKSKGLEYPVVFAAGLHKTFNRSDLNAPVLLDPELGMASDYVNLKTRLKAPTLLKEAIARKQLRESLGEEQRVLYVALTRAKQKLYLSGVLKNEEALREMDLTLPLREELLPLGYLARARGCFDWVIPAALRTIRRYETGLAEGPCPLVLEPVLPAELVHGAAAEGLGRRAKLSRLAAAGPDTVTDTGIREELRKRFSFLYPYSGREGVPAKVSVTELKRSAYPEELAEEELPAYPLAEELPEEETGEAPREEADAGGKETPEAGALPRPSLVPAFMREKEEERTLTGAERGNAWHKVMELLRFPEEEELEERALTGDVLRQMRALTERGRLSEEAAECVRAKGIARFLRSDLGKRMAEADRQGRLFREQAFMLSISAHAVREEWPEDEELLVQGIIDAFFYEEDGIVLVDYKTDRVKSGDELVRRYRVQLASYAEALRRITGKEVKEQWIWSFALNSAVPM